jgi:hypothetical protein
MSLIRYGNTTSARPVSLPDQIASDAFATRRTLDHQHQTRNQLQGLGQQWQQRTLREVTVTLEQATDDAFDQHQDDRHRLALERYRPWATTVLVVTVKGSIPPIRSNGRGRRPSLAYSIATCFWLVSRSFKRLCSDSVGRNQGPRQYSH